MLFKESLLSLFVELTEKRKNAPAVNTTDPYPEDTDEAVKELHRRAQALIDFKLKD